MMPYREGSAWVSLRIFADGRNLEYYGDEWFNVIGRLHGLGRACPRPRFHHQYFRLMTKKSTSRRRHPQRIRPFRA